MSYHKTYDFKIILNNRNKFPIHLYHYYSFNELEDEKLKTVIKPYEDILIHNKLYFSSPKDFNDPFDCSLEMSFSGRKKKVKQYLTKVILPTLLENPAEEIKNEFNHFVEQNWDQINPNNANNAKEMLENQRLFKERSGVFCLTEEKDSILMWSHYSTKHAGFCVEFYFSGLNNDIVSFNKENNLILHLESVDYANIYPKLSGYKGNDMIRALFTKSSKWKYEKEWRIFYSDGAQNKMPLSTNIISAIYLGINVDDKNIEKVKTILKEKQSNINLFKGYKQNHKFAIAFEKIEY